MTDLSGTVQSKNPISPSMSNRWRDLSRVTFVRPGFIPSSENLPDYSQSRTTHSGDDTGDRRETPTPTYTTPALRSLGHDRIVREVNRTTRCTRFLKEVTGTVDY